MFARSGFGAPLFRHCQPPDLQSLNASSPTCASHTLLPSCADNSSPSAKAHRGLRSERSAAQRLDPARFLERPRLLSSKLARLHGQDLEREHGFIFHHHPNGLHAHHTAHPKTFYRHERVGRILYPPVRKDGALSSASQPFLIRLPKSVRQQALYGGRLGWGRRAQGGSAGGTPALPGRKPAPLNPSRGKARMGARRAQARLGRRASANFSRDGKMAPDRKIAAQFGKLAQISPKFSRKGLALTIDYLIFLI